MAEPNKQAKKELEELREQLGEIKKDRDELREQLVGLKRLVKDWTDDKHDDRYLQHEFTSRYGK